MHAPLEHKSELLLAVAQMHPVTQCSAQHQQHVQQCVHELQKQVDQLRPCLRSCECQGTSIRNTVVVAERSEATKSTLEVLLTLH
jgi:hypothetical protein